MIIYKAQTTKHQAAALVSMRWDWYCDLLQNRTYTVRTITHIVASWRLTQLRLRAILPYLTLCAQRSLLRSAIDQLDRLARSDYLESWIDAK
jgi:hypothetical protein